MDKGQPQSEQQRIEACIARVEGGCNKGPGGKGHRLKWSHLRLWQPSTSRVYVQEVLLPEAQAIPKASRQHNEDISARNDPRHNLQLLRLHTCLTQTLHSISCRCLDPPRWCYYRPLAWWCHETYNIAQLLAKSVLFAMVGVVLLDVIRSVLRLQTSSTEVDLQESLRGLTVPHLKVLCGEFQVKPSGTKSELIVNLVTFWKRENSVGESSAGHQRSFADSIDIEAVTGWTKDLTLLHDFNSMHVYDYLIHSQEKEFDRDSLKVFKSLKAYKYFAEGLVMNVSLAGLPGQDDLIAVPLLFFFES